MPNTFDTNGLVVATQAELITTLTAAFQSIYGSDISLASNTPDGQLMMIFIQAILDVENLLVGVYNNFDPDKAIGVSLDQRVAINGIQRQAGTFTVTNVTLTITGSVNLYGLDQTAQTVYTVQDAAGNQWQLVTTALGATSGVFVFQAAVAGAVLTTINTITTPVSVVLGVTAINNPTTYTTLGVNEETDAALRVRRQKSVALSSLGFNASLFAALSNTTGVTSAFIFENDTDAVDVNGVPGHSIWVIVAGSATAANIANAIYQKRNAGCGMFGAQSLNITQADGSLFLVKWDNVASQNLFIKVTLAAIDGLTPPNIDAIRAGLVTGFVPKASATVNTNDLTTAIRAIDSNALVSSPGFSATSGGAYTTTLAPTVKNNQFVVTQVNTVILPMEITSPTGLATVVGGVVTSTLTVAHSGATVQLTAHGGFQANTWSKDSGTGAVNSGSGVYTPPGAAGTDVIRVTDALGNFAVITITIT